MDLIVDGQTVFAATGGRPYDAAKPTIIFVHGAGMDHTVWALQTRYFAHHGHAVLAIDLPGHGKSGGAALPSIAAVADWLAALVTAAGVEKAALVGHSMGALAALDCAARHPDSVSALALLGVAPTMPVHPDLLASAASNDHLAFELITSWAHGAVGHLGGTRTPGLWVMGGAERLLEKAAPGVLSNDLEACNAYQDAQARAEAVTCPTLLVLGRQDKMTPAKRGAQLGAAIADARISMIEGSGHMMMQEKPDETLAALKAFF